MKMEIEKQQNAKAFSSGFTEGYKKGRTDELNKLNHHGFSLEYQALEAIRLDKSPQYKNKSMVKLFE